MTALQPNAFAAGLRKALDIVKDRRDMLQQIATMYEGGRISGADAGSLYQLNQLIDTLSDQLLDAGGFLGDEPEGDE